MNDEVPIITMAGTSVFSGLMVLGLIVLATVLAVVFATRGTMASNREIVDVLHFIGASNSFIAGEFQGRFLSPAPGGLKHVAVNALSRGTLFDDVAPYDSKAWAIPYVAEGDGTTRTASN